MCIIAIKSKGVKMPDEETLRTMWANNSHGAGIMYARDGRVYIDKGYMDWTAFHERIKTLGDVTDTALVMHFRIATHGAVIPGNTHPFPVTDNVAALWKLRCACKVGVAHNGIIPITPRKGISDTMEFIASELAPMAAKQSDWYKHEQVMENIGKRIQSKLAVLDGNGVISYYGDFITEADGMIYSNTSYRPRISATWTYGWKDLTGYGFEDYDKGLPPWDTGRESVWLKSAPEVWFIADNIWSIVDKKTQERIYDIEDLWVDSIGQVYGVDYDSDIAYMLPELEVSGPSAKARKKTSKFRCFKEGDGVCFEYGGYMPFPF